MELALVQQQCVDFRDQVVEEVIRGLSVELAKETVQERRKEMIYRDEIESLLASAVKDIVTEVCR